MAAQGVLRTLHGGRIGFHCPGCRSTHIVCVEGSEPMANNARWGWNGSYEAPTFTPSLHIRTGHYVTGQTPCPFTERGRPCPCSVCHSFVRDGKIQFLSDSTHALAGQTVPLEPA